MCEVRGREKKRKAMIKGCQRFLEDGSKKKKQEVFLEESKKKKKRSYRRVGRNAGTNWKKGEAA